MSVNLLLLYSTAMISAVVARMDEASSYPAMIVFACLMMLFVIMTRIQGVRKPVV